MLSCLRIAIILHNIVQVHRSIHIYKHILILVIYHIASIEYVFGQQLLGLDQRTNQCAINPVSNESWPLLIVRPVAQTTSSGLSLPIYIHLSVLNTFNYYNITASIYDDCKLPNELSLPWPYIPVRTFMVALSLLC